MVFILIVILGGILSFFGPWWLIAPLCFALNYWRTPRSRSAFWTSAVAVSVLWVGYAFYLNLVSTIDLNDRMAGVFIPGGGFPGIILTTFITLLIAILVGGFSGMSGVQVRKFFEKER